MDQKSIHRNELKELVTIILRENPSCRFVDIYSKTHGADVHLVNEIALEVRGEFESVIVPPPFLVTPDYANLPSANPLSSQWWFRQDSAEFLASFASTLAYGGKAGFIGVPSAAHVYSYSHGQAILFDADVDVTTEIRLNSSNESSSRVYNTRERIPDEVAGKCKVAIIDPPWYPAAIKKFLCRASELVTVGGHILCSLPPRLARPGIDKERLDLIEWAIKKECNIVSIEPGRLAYLVPNFESKAYASLKAFENRPWRFGDLLHLKFLGQKPIRASSAIGRFEQLNFTSYSRDKSRFRVFIREQESVSELATFLHLDKRFQCNVSTRKYDKRKINFWTSENVGGTVSDPSLLKMLVDLWSKGLSKNETLKKVRNVYPEKLDLESIVDEVESKLYLWQNSAATTPSKTSVEVALGEWATPPSSNRPYSVQDDGYRWSFQRDRDRIIWSNALRGLANKKQVFLTRKDGGVRQRLTHTFEVMALAKTIGRSLGFNQDLIEAGALVHDIGHTPFGHAGEFALNETLNAVCESWGGFTHYEHGLDVVRWLETPYLGTANGGFPGLNLTAEVAQCILKHTFHYDAGRNSLTKLHARSKHKDYIDIAYPHLEGQAIRIADKVSYLISDLEDGIKLGLYTVGDLLKCRLFNRSPINLVSGEERLYDRFVSQRRLIIKVLMEDIINSTLQRLARLSNVDAARDSTGYTVAFSDDLALDVTEVWNKLQKEILHRDARVVMSNLRSEKIVSQLLILFAFFPDLIEQQFRVNHEQLRRKAYLDFYREKAGQFIKVPENLRSFLPPESTISRRIDMKHVPVYDLVIAKDFVASLTDTTAQYLFNKFLG